MKPPWRQRFGSLRGGGSSLAGAAGPGGGEALSAGVWYVAIDFQLFALAVGLLWLGRQGRPQQGQGLRGQHQREMAETIEVWFSAVHDQVGDGEIYGSAS